MTDICPKCKCKLPEGKDSQELSMNMLFGECSSNDKDIPEKGHCDLCGRPISEITAYKL